MENLSCLKNGRKQPLLTPPPFTVKIFFAIFFVILALNTTGIFFDLKNRFIAIEQAPLDPQSASPLAFIPFHPERDLLSDPLTQAQGIANRLDRNVSQYQKLTQGPELLLIPMMSEPNSFRIAPIKELSLWSLKIAPETYSDGFYSISSEDLALEHFSIRNDLVQIPVSQFNRWVQTAPNKIFMGSNPLKPSDGQYKIEYHAYTIPQLCILGQIDTSGHVTPFKVFIDNPKLPSAKEQLLSQILRFKGSIFSLHLMILTAVTLITIREHTHPKVSRQMFLKVYNYCQYDLLLTPLILFIPQTQRGATIFCLFAISYMTCKIFLKKSVRLIERERINFYR
jgi:hypothetical protein